MATISLQLFVLFEDPFWIGVLKRHDSNRIQACKTVFGQEPSNEQVLEWFLKEYQNLQFSTAVVEVQNRKVKNPKRRQREVKKEVQTGIGTKAQLALKLQQEQRKVVKKEMHTTRSRADKERLFALKQQKRKNKHKGR